MKSKKSNDDEEAPKKQKKQKKRTADKEELKVFSIPYAVQNQFETLKVLAPSSFDHIEKKIEELKDREKLFERGCQEETNVSEEDAKLLG